jgi:hypothetical protein
VPGFFVSHQVWPAEQLKPIRQNTNRSSYSNLFNPKASVGEPLYGIQRESD